MKSFYFTSLNCKTAQGKPFSQKAKFSDYQMPNQPFSSTEKALSADGYYANLQVSLQFIFQFPVHWDTLALSIALSD